MEENISDDKKIYYNNIIDIITDKNMEIKYQKQSIDKIKNSGLNGNAILNIKLPIMPSVEQGLEKICSEAELKWNIDNNLKLGKKFDDLSLEKYLLNINNTTQITNLNKNEEFIISTLINCLHFWKCYFVLNGSDNNYRVKYHKKE